MQNSLTGKPEACYCIPPVFLFGMVRQNNIFVTFVETKNTIMLKEGLEYTSSVVVTRENCASAVGSGGLDVFATPSMVALMENAAMNAVAQYLPAGSTTVGSEINTTHIKPSALGAEVKARAILSAIEGRKLVFYVEAYDGDSCIGKGSHVRFIVDIERFMAKLK
jgi:predicted thioesterase